MRRRISAEHRQTAGRIGFAVTGEESQIDFVAGARELEPDRILIMVRPLFAGVDQRYHHLADCWRGLELVSTSADGNVKPGHIRTVIDRNPVITDIPKVGHT